MAWKKYTPAMPTKASTPISLTIPDLTTRSTPTLRIDDVTAKSLGWKAGASLQILIGEGDHAGKLRIEPAAGAASKLQAPSPTSKAKRSRIVLGRMPCLAEEYFKGAISFEIDRGGGDTCALVLTLPDEARSHQLPPKTAAAVKLASQK